VTWDVTVADTLASSHLSTTARNAGVAAESVTDKKKNKIPKIGQGPGYMSSCQLLSRPVLFVGSG